MPQIDADPLRRRTPRARSRKRLESQRVARDVVAIDQIVANQHVHEPERERGIGAGQQRNMLVAFLRGERAIRIDGDQLRAAALGLLRSAQKCTLEVIAFEPQKMISFACRPAPCPCRSARPSVISWPAVPAEAQMVRSSRLAPSLWKNRMRHRLALHQAHGARVAVRQDLLRIVGGQWA